MAKKAEPQFVKEEEVDLFGDVKAQRDAAKLAETIIEPRKPKDWEPERK